MIIPVPEHSMELMQPTPALVLRAGFDFEAQLVPCQATLGR